MKTQIITLKITVDNMDYEGDYSLPNEWNWQDLLDLNPNESVEVLNSEEVK
jgi:aspartate 1-decarboxylase